MNNHRIKQLEEEIGVENTKCIVELIASSLPSIYDELKKSLDKEDYELARIKAHKLKGTLQTIGLDRYAELFLTIENQSKIKSPFSTMKEVLLSFNMNEVILLLNQYVKN